MFKSLTKLISLSSLIFFLGQHSQAFSQSLIINYLNGETEEYLLSEVLSVKFESNSILIKQSNGENLSIGIEEIFNYEFDLTGLSAGEISENQNTLQIFPNPSSSLVNIEYKGSETGQVLIEILDHTGRVLEVLFNSLHHSRTGVIWNASANSISPGTYFCRVSSPNKVTIGKVIIQ